MNQLYLLCQERGIGFFFVIFTAIRLDAGDGDPFH